MEIIIYKPSNMASPLISTSRLPSKSDNGTKPYRPSSSRGIHLPPISSQTSSNESTPRSEPAAAERLNELLPPMQERLHSAMGQLNNEVRARRVLITLDACRATMCHFTTLPLLYAHHSTYVRRYVCGRIFALRSVQAWLYCIK